MSSEKEVTMTTQTEVQGLGEFARFGFALVYPDDHVVELHHDGEFVARFSHLGAIPQSLRREVMSM